MIEAKTLSDFLHKTHIFTAVVREILEEKYLRQVTDLKITLPQFNLIRLIAINGNHHVHEIASFLGVSQAAASKNVDKLVRLGLLSRRVQPEDRRAASLSLTVRATNIIRKYETLKEERLRKILQDVSSEELHTLTQGLGTVTQSILQCEQDSQDICMKCNAYYMEDCPLQALTDGCIFNARKQAAQ